jgi:hypothetical protein
MQQTNRYQVSSDEWYGYAHSWSQKNKGGQQMSTTPRTDEQVFDWTTEDGSDVVFASFARQLETELVATKKDLVIAHDGLDERDRLRDENKLLAAALAAERKKVRVLRKALENVKDSICRDIPDGYSQPCVDQSADECDKIIEEAMKETSK